MSCVGARADGGALQVVTDLPAVASLVSMVAPDAQVDSLLPTGTSPHHHALKPSRASRLQQAQLVVWIGDALTPWLEPALDALAADTPRLSLLTVEGSTLLPARNPASMAIHEGHDHEHAGGATLDPHAWYDPHNAALWLGAIASRLGQADPDSAVHYASNASRAASRLLALSDRLADELSGLTRVPLVVQHDSLQYLEARFGLNVIGVLSGSDADRPGAARIDRLRQVVRNTPGICLIADPAASPGLLDTVREGSNAVLVTVDPLGLALDDVGAAYYPALLNGLSASLGMCLTRGATDAESQ